MKLRNSGTTVLELLVGLSLIATVLGGGYATLTFVFGINREVINTVQRYEGVALISSHIREAMINYDQHRLHVPPVVHPRGELLFRNGLPFPFSGLTSPHPETEAISYLVLKSEEMLRIHRARVLPDKAVEVHSCAIRKELSGETQKRNGGFLGVSVDGVVPLAAQQITTNSARCYTLKLTLIPSLTVSREIPEVARATVRALLPIDREVTLYLDRRQQLRFLSTRGSFVRENQPLYEKAPLFTLTRKQLTADEVVALELALSERNTQLVLTHHLSRLDPLTVLTYEW